MGRSARGTTCSPTPSSRSRRRPARVCGISSSSATTCGIETCRHRRTWSRCAATAGWSTRSRRSRSRGTYSCSIARAARRSSRSSTGSTRHRTWRAKARPIRSPCRSCLRRSRANRRDRLTTPEIRAVMSDGSGRMPGFARLGSEALSAIQDYILSDEISPPRPPSSEGRGGQGVRTPDGRGGQGVRSPIEQKYRVEYERFLDPDGYPAVKPPWGTLSAIDLSTGRYVWKVPLGEYPELAAEGMAATGCENYGGPLVTAGGLVFIGATSYDGKFRAFDKGTGALLWETTLPAAGNATPATYEVDGRQFVVIATSSGKSRAQAPASYVAFALDQP